MKDGLIEVGNYNGKLHKYVTLTKKGEEFSRKTVDLVLAEEVAAIKYTYYKAQGKTDKAYAYFTLSMLLTSAIAVICWIGLNVFDDQLLRLFGADNALLPLAKAYLRPIQFVIPAYPFTQMLAAYLRNDNAPGFAAFATLCGGCFNIFGDLYFVFGLNMGIFGAGLATAIGVTLTIAVMVSHFFSRKNALRLSRVHGYIHKAKELVFNGCSVFVSEIAMGIIAMLFNRQIMNYFGSNALAVFGVIVQISGPVCDAGENSIDHFYGTRDGSMWCISVRASGAVWRETSMVGHAGYRACSRNLYYFVYGKKQQKPCVEVRNCFWQRGKIFYGILSEASGVCLRFCML